MSGTGKLQVKVTLSFYSCFAIITLFETFQKTAVVFLLRCSLPIPFNKIKMILSFHQQAIILCFIKRLIYSIIKYSNAKKMQIFGLSITIRVTIIMKIGQHVWV